MTKLDQLLASIHPQQTQEVVHRRADEAINGFRIRANIVTDAIVYRDILSCFVEHLDRHLRLVPIHVDRPRDMLWQRAVEVLRKKLGPRAELAAFDMARTGAEGGLYAVLRQLALEAARQQVRKEIDQRVDCFCQRLTAAEYLAAGEEYLQKHGHLLPHEMTRGSAGRPRVNLQELLKRHHQALATLNKVARL